ncbi:MAG: tellurite-resistance/dicarboxylate transporter [Burkholderiaceae bacterium]
MNTASTRPAAAAGTTTGWLAAFAPAWFAAVMGTGVLAVTLHYYARSAPWLDPLAWGLHALNIALAALLGVPWIVRWLRYPQAAIGTLKHPVQAHFYPTFSIALLVLALQCLAFGAYTQVALALWLIGAVLTVVFSVVVLALAFQGEAVTLDHVTPAMFIPPVGLVVIPVAGAPLAAALPAGWRDVLLAFNWAALGAGSLLYVGLLALTMFRYLLHRRVGAPLVPTAWINLGPLGVIPVSLLNLTEAMPQLSAGGVAALVGLLLWGFGAWWLVMASVLTIGALRRGELPFASSWWAFTFPLGAFVAASWRLGTQLALAPITGVGAAALVLLALLWTITFVRSVRGVVDGSLLRPAG